MDFIKTYKIPLIGGLVGLLVALSFIGLGFFKTILLLVLIILGTAAGFALQKSGLISTNQKHKS